MNNVERGNTIQFGNATDTSSNPDGNNVLRFVNTNTGALLAEKTLPFTNGTQNVVVGFRGDDGVGDIFSFEANRDITPGSAELRIVSASRTLTNVDVYIFQRGSGTDLTNRNPVFTIPLDDTGSVRGPVTLPPGDYNVIVTRAGDKNNVLAGTNFNDAILAGGDNRTLVLATDAGVARIIQVRETGGGAGN